jgi:hypothetical protein
VCDVTEDESDDVLSGDELALDAAPALACAAVAVLAEVRSEVAAAVGVAVVLWPSRQASAPPSESIAATLIAVAAFRARAARGVRFRRRSCAGRSCSGCSSMTVNVRTGGEWVARAG